MFISIWRFPIRTPKSSKSDAICHHFFMVKSAILMAKKKSSGRSSASPSNGIKRPKPAVTERKVRACWAEHPPCLNHPEETPRVFQDMHLGIVTIETILGIQPNAPFWVIKHPFVGSTIYMYFSLHGKCAKATEENNPSGSKIYHSWTTHKQRTECKTLQSIWYIIEDDNCWIMDDYVLTTNIANQQEL